MKDHLHDPGRGAPHTVGAPSPVTPQAPLRPANAHTLLPELPPHFVGRDEVARSLAATLLQRRLLSVVGPGGLGKTTLAVAIARRLSSVVRDGILFLDLARLGAGEQLDTEIGLVLGLESARSVTRDRLCERLASRRMLVVLDSCETVIDAAADLVEDLAASAPGLLILATSREPLRAKDEWVHRLAPLASPPEAAPLPAWLAMTYPALQLFIHVAQSRDTRFATTPENLALATTICGRLEGSPLGITLVASNAGRLGLAGIAAQLGSDLLSLEATGLTDRHSSLEAVLDWSYRLLQGDEQHALRALSCLRGSFDLDTAVALVGGARACAMNAVLDLTIKSLLMPQQMGDTTLYRLPDMTRAYASAQLERADAAEFRATRVRHAQALLHLLAAAELQWNSMDRAEWRRCYGVWIEDVRYALRWAFAEGGDPLVGTELTVAVLQLADQTGLFAGFDQFARRALVEVGSFCPERPDLALRLRIFPALAQLRVVSDEPHHLDTLASALKTDTGPGTAAAQLGAMLAIWANSFQLGNYREALSRSLEIQQLADIHADRICDLTARRTRAQSLHFLGEHASARQLILGVLAQAGERIPLAYTPSPVSLDVSTRILLARIYWIEGRADLAWRTVKECLAFAEQDSPPSICQALAIGAIPVALWCGHRTVCADWVGRLLAQTEQYEFSYYRTWARLTEVVLNAAGSSLPAHAAALQTLPTEQQRKYCDHLGTFEPASLPIGTFERAQSGAAGWCAPEVIRLRAEHVAAAGGPEAQATASALLAQALCLARTQGALAWELRIAVSSARLSRRWGEPATGRELLATVHARFTEGFETQDLRNARELLSGR